jgi:hypothetical protein
MKTLITLLLLVSAAAAANLSGIWTGAFRAVGGDRDVPQLLVLKQEGVNLTGTGGPDSTEQYPVINGTVAGDVVKFEVKTAQREFFYDLKGRDKELRGSLTIKSSHDTRTAKVWLDRAH